MIHYHFKVTAAILDAILEITPFLIWDFLGFLECYSWSPLLHKSVGNTRQCWTANKRVQCKAICIIGGHLRRHFEYIKFPIVWFCYIFIVWIVMSHITKIRWKNTFPISHNLKPLTDYGGHLGRHLENNLFPIEGFSGISSVLFVIPNTTKIRWKNTFMLNC